MIESGSAIMTATHSDALAFFGATGDLACKKIFPALVRGQFRGYRQEEGVAPDSAVETFAAVQLTIDSWRWDGVPFLIRAGKCLPTTATLFARQDAVEAAWAIVQPILRTSTPLHEYAPGTWGPPEAEQLAAEEGGWHCPAGAEAAA